MRVVEEKQMMLGEVSIANITFNPKSRDDIDQLLKGLQHLYKNVELREKLFGVLEKMIPNGIAHDNGRPGMHLWRVFVLGMLRLNLNWDYDRLHNMVNYHSKIREMLGHPEWDDYVYELQTIKDNFRLFTLEILDEINQIVVLAGHQLLKKKTVV
jgi:hypothetical protein